MSHAELQKLLYGALASGSGAEISSNDNVDAALAAQSNIDAVTIHASTPAEIIAHYDFRVKSGCRED